ncbi:MAG TPA: HD domain-containing phosphohydrolase [Terriglobales bacterium]|nr:HD domain-containing phosphohydrolase [Terriglobales bacterium]
MSTTPAQTIHDIRNALNVIMGNAQLLQGPDPLTAKQKKYIERILHASREMLSAIQTTPPEPKTEKNELKLRISVVEEQAQPEMPAPIGSENKVLFVDDDPAILEQYREMAQPGFDIDTAIGGKEGLAAVGNRGPYTVIVSDMEMPGMSGVDFLSQVRVIAPDTIRIMLTGHADVNVAMHAVNQGHIFRFLTKPCDRESLTSSLSAGLVRYRLVAAEKEILENTLIGSIKVLTDVLSAVNPEAFGRSLRIADYVRQLVAKFKLPAPWHFEAAAMLSQLGCITLNSEVLRAAYAAAPLSPEDQARFDAHPKVAEDLLCTIPRLEAIAWMVGQQLMVQIPPSAPEVAALTSDVIVAGAKILKLAVAFDGLRMKALSNEEAITQLRSRVGEFDSQFLDAMMSLKSEGSKMVSRKIPVTKLIPGMVLQQEIKAGNGLLIVTKGQEITRPLLARLLNFVEAGVISDEILALVPIQMSS